MKHINEQRINNTYKFLEDYYRGHGACPTYREIKDACGYSTLSLVHSDIDRLKQRGVVVDDSFAHIKLVEQKETNICRYDYPFLIMTDATHNVDRLNDEEKLLLESQENYLKGEYEKSLEQADYILKNSKDQSVLFGAKLTKCCSSLYIGNSRPWNEFFRSMISHDAISLSEKMEKELMAQFLSTILGDSKTNCPAWLSEGRFFGLRKEAYPLAELAFLAKIVKEQPDAQPHYLEPLCSESRIQNIEYMQVYMDLYMAIIYHYSGGDKYTNEHVMSAIDTCLRRGWYTPLAEMKRPLGTVLEPFLEDYGEQVKKKINDLNKKLFEGFNKIHNNLIGEDQTKGLSFREIEIVNFVRLNLTTKEIAGKLYISAETVKKHLSSIYLKIGVSGRKELKALIKKHGSQL